MRMSAEDLEALCPMELKVIAAKVGAELPIPSGKKSLIQAIMACATEI